MCAFPLYNLHFTYYIHSLIFGLIFFFFIQFLFEELIISSKFLRRRVWRENLQMKTLCISIKTHWMGFVFTGKKSVHTGDFHSSCFFLSTILMIFIYEFFWWYTKKKDLYICSEINLKNEYYTVCIETNIHWCISSSQMFSILH